MHKRLHTLLHSCNTNNTVGMYDVIFSILKFSDTFKDNVKNFKNSMNSVNYQYMPYTYIHNWLLQHFSQDYGLAFRTTHVVCVNFIRGWRDLQFNFDSERQIVVVVVVHLLSEEIATEIFFFILRFGGYPGIRTQSLRLINPLDYDD